LNTVAAAMALLGAKAEAVQPLFVTVDPDRDTPAVLAPFVAAFDSRLIGLTGSPAQIRQVTQDYRVYVAKGEGGGDTYTVDHSAYTYVIGPDGRVLTYLKHDTIPQAMAKALERLMTQQTSVGGPWN
jgi:protein SCO1/2